MFAGYLIILATRVMCDEFSQCYNDVNICLWTEGAKDTRSEAQAKCTQPNSFIPRVTSSDIQDELEAFRLAVNSEGNLLGNNGFWIDVSANTISLFHWVEGSPLTGRSIYEFAGIVSTKIMTRERAMCFVLSSVFGIQSQSGDLYFQVTYKNKYSFLQPCHRLVFFTFTFFTCCRYDTIY